MLPDFESYCQLIAGLPDRYLSIRSSTLTAYTIGPFAAEIEGVITFEKGFVLEVWELIDLSRRAITSYSYTVDGETGTKSEGGGMTRKLIRTIPLWLLLIPIINMFIRISSGTGFPRREFHLTNPTCRF